jgi:hypothetical protein
MIKRVGDGQLEARAWASSSRSRPSCTSPRRATTRTLGARPLRRAIQRMVEDPSRRSCCTRSSVAGEIIVVDTEDDPEAVGDKRLTFRGVEGFVPPDSPADMVAGDSAE